MKTWVKELRLAKHVTQIQLAVAIGCSQNTISRIELEEAIPNGDVLIKIAQYFNVTVDYLLFQSEQKHSYPPTTLSLAPRVVEYAKKLQHLSSDNKDTVFVVIDHLISTQSKKE